MITNNNKNLTEYKEVKPKQNTIVKYQNMLGDSGKLLGIYRRTGNKKRQFLLVQFYSCNHICLIRSDSSLHCAEKNCLSTFMSNKQKEIQKEVKGRSSYQAKLPQLKQKCSNWSKQYYSNSKNREYHKQRTIDGMHEEIHWNNFLNTVSERFSKPDKRFIENYIAGRIKDQQQRANKDELKLITLLENNNIQYEWQKGIYDEENNKIFIIDFYLPDYNKYIELDGGSHNRSHKQKRDLLLDNYCIKNNLSLLHLVPEQLDTLEIFKIL